MPSTTNLSWCLVVCYLFCMLSLLPPPLRHPSPFLLPPGHGLQNTPQVLCYEDNRLLKLFKDIVKLLYNAGG